MNRQINYKTMRVMVGIIAIILAPVVCLLADVDHPLTSISISYWTNSHDIFVGSLERDPGYASPTGIQKFSRYFPVVFQDENVTIYRADQPLSEGTP